jgi:hypothetical protein
MAETVQVVVPNKQAADEVDRTFAVVVSGCCKVEEDINRRVDEFDRRCFIIWIIEEDEADKVASGIHEVGKGRAEEEEKEEFDKDDTADSATTVKARTRCGIVGGTHR